MIQIHYTRKNSTLQSDNCISGYVAAVLLDIALLFSGDENKYVSLNMYTNTSYRTFVVDENSMLELKIF